MSFKIGDKVRITYNEPTVNEINGGLGMEGEIIDVHESDPGVIYSCKIKSKSFVQDYWWFVANGVELITNSVPVFVPVSNRCPRCSGQMVLKSSIMLLGEKLEILKCDNCGYC